MLILLRRLAGVMVCGVLASFACAAPPDNTPPAGFTALFNGRDLSGWKGLVADPPKRAAMSVAELSTAQADADRQMREHWSVKDGVLVFDGHGASLCTGRDFGDFEMYVDWKIDAGGDSGIYLRGSPQVQIWDNPIGSGGLYNNQKNQSTPLTVADKPIGEWNTFHIFMRGERVTVYLNGRLVVDDTPMENYWERNKPIYPTGQIELQNHSHPLYFRNIYVRDLPPLAHAVEPRMDWWEKARFGMFIHWGLYAIPAGVWEGKSYPPPSEWLMDMAKIPPAEYEKLAARFNPEKFDARAWARMAKRAGQKYMVITSKHHEGFCLFDSKYTTYDVMDATPFKRDVMKELSDACRAEGIRMCWYHSIMDWHHPDARGANFPKYEQVLRNQVTELLTKYGDIGVMWFDGEWIGEWTEEKGKSLYALCRSLQPNVIVNNRVGKGRSGMAGMSATSDAAGDFGTPEQEIPATGFPGRAWESCMTMNDTWGFHQNDHHWKSARTMIRMLCETASKGGNFLLNVGPRADGTFPPEIVERLDAIGAWMDVNSEAIYGTGASPFRKLPWGRCTSRPGRLYFLVMDWPKDGVLRVPGLRNDVTGAWLLGSGALPALGFSRDADDVLVNVPTKTPNEDCTVVALDIAGDPLVVVTPILQSADGALVLRAEDADVHGAAARYEHGDGKDNVGYWTDPNDTVSWNARITRPGRFRLVVDLACAPGSGGSEYRVRVGDKALSGRVAETGSWTTFKAFELGDVEIDKAGDITVTVEPTSKPGMAVMNLKDVRLVGAR